MRLSPLKCCWHGCCYDTVRKRSKEFAGRLAARVNQDCGIILAMRGTKRITQFGQQPGLRPEPRLSGQCTRTTRLDAQCVRAMAEMELAL